ISGSSSTIKTRSMPDVLPPDQENHHFRNVGRMISNTFEVLGDKYYFQRPRDVLGVLHHISEELPKDLLVAIIDELVVTDHLFRQLHIRVHKCIEAMLQY